MLVRDDITIMRKGVCTTAVRYHSVLREQVSAVAGKEDRSCITTYHTAHAEPYRHRCHGVHTLTA